MVLLKNGEIRDSLTSDAIGYGMPIFVFFLRFWNHLLTAKRSWQLDLKTKRSLRCLLAKATW